MRQCSATEHENSRALCMLLPLLGKGPGCTGIELSELRQDRSADFSPLPAVLGGLERGGLKSALLNSMAVLATKWAEQMVFGAPPEEFCRTAFARSSLFFGFDSAVLWRCNRLHSIETVGE